MNHVRAITVTGHEVELSHDEISRIIKSMNLDDFHKRVEERNQHYYHKACESIREIAEKHGYTDLHGTEEEYKQILSDKLGDDIGDLIVEIAEQRIAAHHMKIYSE